MSAYIWSFLFVTFLEEGKGKHLKKVKMVLVEPKKLYTIDGSIHHLYCICDMICF
jgi:hypothetical protein